MRDDLLGFGGKADDQHRPVVAPARRPSRGCRGSPPGAATAAPCRSSLISAPRPLDPPVGDSGGHTATSTGSAASLAASICRRGLDRDERHARPGRLLGRAGNQHGRGAACRQRGGDRVPLLARGMVRNVAHRVDRLAGRAAGDQRPPPASGNAESAVTERARSRQEFLPARPCGRTRPRRRPVSPAPGPTCDTPRCFRTSEIRLGRRVRPHLAFIAGAISTGLSEASSSVAARSSASPAAMRAIRSAVAGATTTRSASRDSRMWPISPRRSATTARCRPCRR